MEIYDFILPMIKKIGFKASDTKVVDYDFIITKYFSDAAQPV